jgi:thiol-disulfide isomerase/thioredoxin
MDRLPALTLAATCALSLLGCNDKPKGEPAGRANSAKVAATQGADPEAFCDKLYADETGPAVSYPAVVDGTLPAPSAHPRWINVWATWCKPCTEEIPRLLAWKDKLATAGKPFDLVLMSVDEDPADVAEFRKEQGAKSVAVPTTRLATPGDERAWYPTVGLDAGAPVPVHVFVTAAGHVRCARAGSVREKDYAVVEKLLAP